jgi:hypothetical protein
MLQNTSTANRPRVSILAEIEQRRAELHRLAGRPQSRPLIRPSEPEIDPFPPKQSPQATPRPECPQPVLAEPALHGLAGLVVHTIAPQIEAQPAAILLQFLAAFGNLFVVLVGESSKARKGTSSPTKSTLGQSFNTTLLVAFAALSLVLAAVGLFGVMSYIVAQRTAEIALRIALGAKRGHVMRKMLLDGMRPAVSGLVVGLAASLEAGRLVRDLLYEIKPLDPAVFAAVAATLLLVAAFACIVPAWRASRLDPLQALRSE